MYSEYAKFLSKNKASTKNQYPKNLINIKYIYDAAAQISETKKQRNSCDDEGKIELIKISSHYFSVLDFLNQNKIVSAEYTCEDYKKINDFLISIIIDKKGNKDLREAAARVFYKQDTLPDDEFLHFVSVLMDETEGMGLRPTIANELISNSKKFQGKLLSDDMLSSLSIILKNKNEKEKIRRAAGKLLLAQKTLSDDFIYNNMPLLTAVLKNKGEDVRLRRIIVKMFEHLCRQSVGKVPDNIRLASIYILIDKNDDKNIRMALARLLTDMYRDGTYILSTSMNLLLMESVLNGKLEYLKIINTMLNIMDI